MADEPLQSLAATADPSYGGGYFLGMGSNAAVTAQGLGYDTAASDVAIGFDTPADAPPIV